MPDKRNRRKTPSPPEDGKQTVSAVSPLKKLKALIKSRPPFRDERLAPDVDHELLLALVRQELSEAAARDVYRFVHSFKSWSDAYCDLLVHEFCSTQNHSADPR